MNVAANDFFHHMDDFMDYRKVVFECSPETLKTNLIDLKLFENFITGNKYDVIDGRCAMNFQYYLKQERNNCGASINRKIFTLKSYSHFLGLQDVENVYNLPFHNILKIRQGYRNQPDALTQSQLKTVFDTIDRQTFLGIRDYAVYALMYLAGLRVGEVFKLDLDDIQLEEKTLHVTGKGNKKRTLHISPELFSVITEYLTVRSEFFKSEQTDAFFVSKKGNRLAIRTMEDNFKKLLAKSNLDVRFKVTCHTLRHTFASHLNDKEVDILVIQSLMGHTTPRSTEPYIHPSSKVIRDAMEKLPAVIHMKKLLENGELILNFQSIKRQRE